MAAAANLFPKFLLGRRWRGISKNLDAQEEPLKSLQKRFGFKADNIVTTAMPPLQPAKAA
jgi:hypothetical protein